jgi:hypothetical protein
MSSAKTERMELVDSSQSWRIIAFGIDYYTEKPCTRPMPTWGSIQGFRLKIGSARNQRKVT